MDRNRALDWLSRVRYQLDPPGSETVFLDSPGDPGRCCTCGIMSEHRFAFFFWALFGQETKTKRGRSQEPPCLVTIDYHDDVGAHSDVIPEDLDSLDLSDRMELALFCWTRLAGNNDGQIRPALYLNLFGDVYVLLKQDREQRKMYPESAFSSQEDRFGREHRIEYFDAPGKLAQALAKSGHEHVYLDIDLDYFTSEEKGGELGSASMAREDDIRAVLNLRTGFVSHLYDRLVGLTIALEPKHCGGFANAFRILDVLNGELFGGTLGTHRPEWRCR